MRVLGAFTVLGASLGHGQVWLRESLQVPEVMTGGASVTENGDTDADEISGRVTLLAGFEYTDNVMLSENGDDGLAFVYGGTGGFRMPLTVNNELYFQATAMQRVYISGEEGETDFASIAPGSNLGMDVFVGQAKIRGFANISLQEDPVESIVVNETDQFGRFNLDTGVQADWNMNKVVLQGMAMTGWQWQTSGDGSLDAQRAALNLRAYFPQNGSNGWGITTGWSEVDFDLDVQNDSETFSIGVLGQQILSRSTRVSAEIGWQNSTYARNGSIGDYDDYEGLYGALQFDHQVRRALRYSLVLRHDANDGIGTNYFGITSVILTPQVTLWRQTHMGVVLGYDWIDESGPVGETATRANARLRLERALSSQLSGSVEWQYLKKDSDLAGRSFERNMFTLMFEYAL